MKAKLLLVICIVTIISSCKEVESTGLVGKWKFTEMYGGYANGGSYLWKKVDSIYSHTLEFTSDGKYSKKEEFISASQICSGTYRQLLADTVEISSNCQNGVERAKVSELTNKELILDYQVREGVIRYKYSTKR